MKVLVAFSPGPREIDLSEIEVPEGSSVAVALEASRVLERHAALAMEGLRTGVWGHACSTDRRLREGDRVEVYRALKVDPKEARRRRGQRQKRRPTMRP